MVYKIFSYFQSAIPQPFNKLFSKYYTIIKYKFQNKNSKSLADIRIKNIVRNAFYGKIKFISIDDLTRWTNEWLKEIPNNYDLIVGIPRSGLLVANIISLKFGKPLATPSSLSDSSIWFSKRMPSIKSIDRILLIEDATSSCNSLEEASLQISKLYPNSIVDCGSLIFTGVDFEEKLCKIKYNYMKINQPAIYEWHIMHRKFGVMAIDLDGVICENCPSEIDLDDDEYDNWIKNAKPHFIPNFEFEYIITNRLEKFRKITELWLQQNNVRYRELIMWDLSEKAERNGKFSKHKIEMVMKTRPNFVLESNKTEAFDIWYATGTPTLCIDSMQLFT